MLRLIELTAKVSGSQRFDQAIHVAAEGIEVESWRRRLCEAFGLTTRPNALAVSSVSTMWK